MNKRTWGVVALVVGVLLLVVALGADALGLGHGGIGWKQIVMAGAGAAVAVVGVVFAGQR